MCRRAAERFLVAAAGLNYMARELEGRKGKRVHYRKKLPPNCKVEVRSLEDGFQGSWHTGTIIACDLHSRVVRYDHSLSDDGAGPLVETIRISPDVEGSSDGNCYSRCKYRGRIRPLPPVLQFGPQDLLYGLCVDVYYQEGWWDGVIFDHNDGAENRHIFFPDLGDDLVTGISNIRISQHWVEDKDTWERCGIWFFLQLVKDWESKCLLPVSVKQIWYDSRQSEGFEKIKEWTMGSRLKWEKLVLLTISQNFSIAFSDIYPQNESKVDLAKKQLEEREFLEQSPELAITIADSVDPLSLIPADEPSNPGVSYASNLVSLLEENDLDNISPLYDHTPVKVKATSHRISRISCKALSRTKSERKKVHPGDRESKWRSTRVPRKFSPESLASYLDKTGEQDKNSRLMAVRQHLSSLGWHMECAIGEYPPRVRYLSPCGKYYYSLVQICRALRGNTVAAPSLSSENAKSSVVASCNDNSEPQEDVDDTVQIDPAYYPQAVVDYYELELEKSRKSQGTAIEALRLKTRQHLVAIGWKLFFHKRSGKREMVYMSPRNRRYLSLRTACKACIDEEGIREVTGRIGYSTEHIEGSELVLHSKFQKDTGGMQVCSNARPHKLIGGKLGFQNAKASSLFKKRKSSGDFTKLRYSVEASQPSRVLQSTKRVQQIAPCPFQQNPRNLLSWLIDNNFVLPRDKVYCQADGGSRNLVEGRIHRDGIKCSCCSKVYTLSGFNSHVGSTCSRPSAGIFLQDGRSLLNCQMQILCGEKTSCLARDPDDELSSRENDWICSVCHYGGDLILCDQCPSSFHMSCLGLEEVPDGNWFCPSCCCCICGQTKFKTEIDHSSDSDVLRCSQCEQKYHAGCLRKRRAIEFEKLPRGNWYCTRKCQKISVGLSDLLGKPFRVGDNLTWTMLKFVDPNNYRMDTPVFEALVENYIKLKIALDVMHECFEPVKESSTKRDLVEDVIFSRGSELNRLNFQGFYTVVLEKGDELVTVANVRIYGEKVAELPLIGTRFKFRRLGMCRILMSELEKSLRELGVERLVLPAVPSVLSTWTNSFGFTKMTESERLHLLGYTFLDFQDTIMCQKHLLRIPRESRICRVIDYYTKKSSDIDMEVEDASAVSEDLQACAVETNKIFGQGLMGNADFDENGGDGNKRFLKCYQRRRYLSDRRAVR